MQKLQEDRGMTKAEVLAGLETLGIANIELREPDEVRDIMIDKARALVEQLPEPIVELGE